MICKCDWHKGDREVFVIKSFQWRGQWFEGCRQCTYGIVPSLSTEKREVISKGTHKPYYISAAHRQDIKSRRSTPDLKHVYRDKRGTMPDISHSREFDHEMASGMDAGVGMGDVKTGDK